MRPKIPVPHPDSPDGIARRWKIPKDQSQASAIQSALCDTFLAFHAAFAATQELPLRHGIADTMQSLARSWREVVATRREILGKPKVGSLSPAERVAAAQRSRNRTPRAAPFVVAPKESLSQAAPSPRGGVVGGATTGEVSQGSPAFVGSRGAVVPSEEAVPFVPKVGGGV